MERDNDKDRQTQRWRGRGIRTEMDIETTTVFCQTPASHILSGLFHPSDTTAHGFYAAENKNAKKH